MACANSHGASGNVETGASSREKLGQMLHSATLLAVSIERGRRMHPKLMRAQGDQSDIWSHRTCAQRGAGRRVKSGPRTEAEGVGSRAACWLCGS